MKSRFDTGKTMNWPGTVLRICIVSLIIFLVQILIQLYRYNSRLVSFYASRRDALILAKGDGRRAKELADMLTPNGLDFGREPNHPLVAMAGFFKKGKKDDETTMSGDKKPPSPKPAG